MKRERTEYTVSAPGIPEKLRFAVVADLHSAPYDDVLEDMLACDAVLLPGDLMDRHRRDNHLARQFLREVPLQLPVFYSIGNHEAKYRNRESWRKAVDRSDAVLLDNESCLFRGICIGGLSSRRERKPSTAFLDAFEQEPGFKLLLCHQPEIYRDYVRGRNIDLTLCGHTHGGQIQIRGRGLYAPGQGIFPRMTHGMHDDGRMLISRGMTNAAMPRLPRIGNPCELILLTLEPEKEGGENESGRPAAADGMV